MKNFVTLIVFAFMSFTFAAKQRDYVKILKVEFNQTGNSCKDPYVRLRPLSRYDTAVDADCNLQRPIYGVFINFRFFVKTPTSKNYRQTMALTVEPCKIMANRKWFPPLNYLFDRGRQLYPKYVHDCPYTEFKIENFTFYFLNDLTEEDKKWLIFPNGIYLIQAHVWDNTTDEGYIRLWAETKFQHRSLTPSDLMWSGDHIFG